MQENRTECNNMVQQGFNLIFFNTNFNCLQVLINISTFAFVSISKIIYYKNILFLLININNLKFYSIIEVNMYI